MLLSEEALAEVDDLFNPIAEKYINELELPKFPSKIAPFAYLGMGEFPMKNEPFEDDFIKYIPSKEKIMIQPDFDPITGDIVSYKDIIIKTDDENSQENNINDNFKNHKKSIDFNPLIDSLKNHTNLLTDISTNLTERENTSSIDNAQLENLDNGNEIQKKSQESIQKKYKGQFDSYDVNSFDADVPNKAIDFNFPLDDFQKRSIYRLERDECVFVSAPTSAGKTVIAQYAIALCRSHKMKAIYTSPIKALSNQKYMEFKKAFNDVGILTGDVTLNRDASVLIMTTEILRTMLYSGDDTLRNVESVIFDECHYIADNERGVVWEECIILMPHNINMVFLSATVPNAAEIANWIACAKGKDVYVEYLNKRPIPLLHSIYVNNSTYNITDENKNFKHNELQRAKEKFLEREKKMASKKPMTNKNKSKKRPDIMVFDWFWREFLVRNQKEKFSPLLLFAFSRNKCNEYAQKLINAIKANKKLELIDSNCQNAILTMFDNSLQKLSVECRTLKQVTDMRNYLQYGIGIHHAGVLPILKEMIEILLAQGYLKILVCTSTFAMGINVPVKTCIFSSATKFNGKEFVPITKTEYLQMSGRAGRRGLDEKGRSILVIKDEFPKNDFFEELFLGEAENLESQFKIRFNMVLAMIRTQGIQINDFISNSLSKQADQAKVRNALQRIQSYNNELNNFPKIECAFEEKNDEDIEDIDIESSDYITLLFDDIFRLNQINSMIIHHENSSYKEKFINQIRKGVLCLYTKDTCEIVICTINSDPSQMGNSSTDSLIQIYSAPNNEFETSELEFIHILQPLNIGPDQKPSKKKKESIISHFKPKDLSPTFYEKFFQSNDKLFHNYFEIMERVLNSKCIGCSRFKEHYILARKKFLIQKKINEEKKKIKTNVEIDSYYELLRDIGYIDQNYNLTLKGRTSLEIKSAHELIVNELLFNDFFVDLSVPEIASIASTLVAQNNGKIDEGAIPKSLEQKFNKMIEIGEKVYKELEDHNIPTDFENMEEFIGNHIKKAVMVPVYNWSNGATFPQIMKDYNKTCQNPSIQEGVMVRLILQSHDLLKDLSSAASVMGSHELRSKFESACESIKRDIVFTNSLYLD